VYEEPLDIWKERYCEKDGSNILGKFYSDMQRWSFDFEVMAFTTRKKQLLDAIADPSDVIIIERSLYTDRRTFAINLYNNGTITEMQWKIYDDFFWSMMAEVKRYFDLADCYYLYIDTSPNVCWFRSNIRNRKEEKEMMPGYLRQLDEMLKSWLSDADTEFPVIKVNGEGTEQDVLNQTMKLIGPPQL
jgi:deoxyadenosine/deoxycytidine kinase